MAVIEAEGLISKRNVIETTVVGRMRILMSMGAEVFAGHAHACNLNFSL